MYGSNPLYPHDSSKIVPPLSFRTWTQKTNWIPKRSRDFHRYPRTKLTKPQTSKKTAKNRNHPIQSARSLSRRRVEQLSKNQTQISRSELKKRKGNYC